MEQLKLLTEKKNMIKPPHGEYVAVERLESIYKNSIYVENICVYACGDKNELLALISPNKKNVHTLAATKSIDNNNFEELCNNPDIRKLILGDLMKIAKSSGLKGFEYINIVKLYPIEWTPENGFLTSAMKLKRYEVHKRLKNDIESLYQELEK